MLVSRKLLRRMLRSRLHKFTIMKKVLVSLAAILTTTTSSMAAISLAGEWKLSLDAEDHLIKSAPTEWTFPDSIALPGTTDLAGKGPHITKPIPFAYHLNREFAFVGPAYYSREISIAEDWKGSSTELFLERVMWQSRVWVDGKEISAPQDSLNTPHRHELGELAPGNHQLVIRVDNRMTHPIGDKGHAYGDQTQSLWNGIVGKIELRKVAPSHVSLLRVFPSNDGNFKVEVSGKGAGNFELRGKCSAGESAKDFVWKMNATGDFKELISGKIDNPQIWSEFNPKTYQLQLDLYQDEKIIDTKTTSFGFREVSHEGNKLSINGVPAFMRGNLECAVFPLTGHPPVTVEGWKKVWQVYRDYNMNHARFHSWCPPEAAFIAADEMGIYLQVEAPIWIDHWMTKPNTRKEMDTLGYPQGLGKADRTTDEFTQAEIRRTIDTYGNHPSFVFFALGNELGTSDFEVTGTWIRDAKKHDPRHLYAASTARTITPFCDFNATHAIPDIGWVRQTVNFGTDWNYEEKYTKAPVPIIAHEIGQWPVYVDWKKELPKYTGPLKPYRLAEMAEVAKKNGLYDRSEELKLASGASNRILYRDEIESFLRTPSCRGFQLLSMQDFSGQGEALVGWLDSFYESKGTTNPAEFRRYCAPTVPLLKLPGYVFTTTENPEIEALLHHYGAEELFDAQSTWQLTTIAGTVVDSGSLETKKIARGTVESLGKFSLDFSTIKQATQLKLSIRIAQNNLSNDYDLWVFPKIDSTQENESIVITSDWEGVARPALTKGKSVLLIANQLGGPQATRQAQWFPLYWSVPFFPGQNRETIGLRVSAEHPAFAKFPTSPFGDWNWFRLAKGARGFDLTDKTPNIYRPIAEPVTDFHYSRRLASIFEGQVNAGKLLICGYNITQAQAELLPEAAQLRSSLISYVSSPQFSPKTPLKVADLDALFYDPTIKLQKLAPRFESADLYVNAGGKLGSTGASAPWEKGQDQILRQAKGVDYVVKAEGSYRDENGTAWFGKVITLTITPRAGVPGKLLVRFHDWNKNGRTGTVEFEGKTLNLEAHTEGGWVELPVIREDTNDGQLLLTATTLSGPNLMITDIAFVPEEE